MVFNTCAGKSPPPVRPRGPRDWRKPVLCFFGGKMSSPRRTSVYIDGLNLYYGLLKGTPFKWLDLKAMVSSVLPQEKNKHYQINSLKYFTTKVKEFPGNPGTAFRQKIYLRALQFMIPELTAYYGHFLVNTMIRPLVKPITSDDGKEIRFVYVYHPQEKGSDVNLAVHLVNDALLDKYDWAVAVTNDSDLSEAFRLVKERGKHIFLIPTFSRTGPNVMRKPTPNLLRYTDRFRLVKTSTLKKCQLPEVIPGTNIHRPAEWK